MRSSPRLKILCAILAVLAALVFLSEPASKAQVVAAAPPRPGPALVARAPAAAAPPAELLLLRPRTLPEGAGPDAFPARDWTPPPPPPLPAPPALPPAPPQAPALPFAFIGKEMDGGQWIVFLSQQDRTYVVKAGDVIESTYRIDSIAPPTLTSTYLPLVQQQLLDIGSAE